jgi:hypothetical protein
MPSASADGIVKTSFGEGLNQRRFKEAAEP